MKHWTQRRKRFRMPPALILCAGAAATTLSVPKAAPAQAIPAQADTATIGDDEPTRGALQALRGPRRSRLTVSTGKTYNRVEGLPVHIGPVFTDSSARLRFRIELLGILRSANEFHWDADNVGHLARVELSGGRERAPALAISTYDVVDAVEDWQMPRGESGIAAFLFRRDYRDHFGRHGAAATLTVYPRSLSEITLGIANERWTARDVRSVLTIFRNNHAWRANPVLDGGHARLLTLRWLADSRNDARNPSAGWLTTMDYENGRVREMVFGESSPVARLDAPQRSGYGRILFDVRKYSRISPESQVNVRVVAGGWIHGGELPLQRRLSVGGPGTIPGFDFRDAGASPDVGTCSAGDAPAGVPAQCERVLLAQIEYRDELPIRPGTIFGGTPFRIRSAALTLRPVLVAFADFGRGWLLPPRDGAAPSEVPRDLVYRSGTVPPLRTFRTDVGLGIDLGLFGVYVAKAVSDGGQPANLILRARSRF